MNGAKLIERERARQVLEEGYGAEHDATYTGGELRSAAICYALGHTQFWPDDWDVRYWKPTRDPVRDLVKAGALIAAEIDRLLREQGQVVAGIPPVAGSDRDEHVYVSVEDMERVTERRREMEQTIRQMDARISELGRDVRDVSAELGKALAERDAAREEGYQLRLHSSRLVELLSDAWWVQAAYALNKVRELTGVD